MGTWAWFGRLVFAASLALPASAAEKRAVVWYRASDQCPSGQVFIERLSERAVVRLAKAGDHIDFVVTLVADEAEVVGRLERQTQSGTVAIRELRDQDCSRVADALALSLALALERPSGERADEAAPAGSLPESSPPNEVAPSEPAAPTTHPAQAAAGPRTVPGENSGWVPPEVESAKPQQPPVPVADLRSRISLGAGGGVLTGVAEAPVVRANVWFGVDEVAPQISRHLAVRAGVVGALGSVSTRIGDVRRWVLAGRLEGCRGLPLSARWSLSPCVAFELGATGGSSSRSTGEQAATIWVAPGGVLQTAVRVLSTAGLYGDVGALVPLARTEVYAGNLVVYRDDIVAVHGGLGVFVQLP